MANLTAARLRDLARRTMLDAGGRGFLRFTQEKDALLATDAVRRCGDVPALMQAMEKSGFSCRLQDGLLYMTPKDALLRALIWPQEPPQILWEEWIHPAQAIAARWLSAPENAWTDAGRQLVLDALRLTGTPGCDVLRGIELLRTQAAVMLRMQDRSGMREAGAILAQWCEQQTEQNDRRRME